MAGIGFELKKLLQERTVLGKVRAFSYATLVSAGPMIISVILIILLGQIMKHQDIPIRDREFVNAIIMYAFIFSMILVSGPSILVSRYVADQYYLQKQSEVLGSLLGTIALVCSLALGFGILFFWTSTMPVPAKILGHFLFIELSVLYILMIYVSTIKSYKSISLSFLLGILVSLLGMGVFSLLHIPMVEAVLAGVCCGFFSNLVTQLVVIRKHYETVSGPIFPCLDYFHKMPGLFFLNVFYAISLFGHNFIYWLFSGLSVRLMSNILFSPTYDSATFFAVLTILPSSVLFVVKVETSFFEKFVLYSQAVRQGGTYHDIEAARNTMVQVLLVELSDIFLIQFLFSLTFVVLGSTLLLPFLNLASEVIELYAILCIGFFLSQMTYIIVTILLYFDNQKDSLITNSVLLASTLSLSVLTLFLGEKTYGLGFAGGSLIALIVAVRFLFKTLEQIDYRLFNQ